MTTADLTPPLDDVEITAPAPTESGPRIRWAGIVWGFVLSALAITALVVVIDPQRRSALRDALLTIDPSSVSGGAIVAYVAIGAGVVLLIVGGLSLLRRSQRETAQQRE